MKATIQRYPVIAYFILVYAIAWIGSWFAVGPEFLRGDAIAFSDMLAITVPMLTAPALVGITLTAVVDGKRGLRSLFSRMSRWRVDVRWYAALLIFPILILAASMVLFAVVSPDFAPIFFPFGILMGVAAGYLEEIGWMGFAFPRMQQRYNALTVGILLGILHVSWHLAADYLGASALRGIYWLPHFLAFSVAMTAMRVLVVWVYVNTTSVLLSQLMHASSTGFLAALVPVTLSPYHSTIFYTIYAVTLWIAVAMLAKRYGRSLQTRQ